MHMRHEFLPILAIVLAGTVPLNAADAPASAPTTTQASGIEDLPPDTVLIRIGDADKITQQDFERAGAGSRPNAYANILDRVLADRVFLVYLKENPHLATDADVDQLIDTHIKNSRKTREQWFEDAKKKGFEPDFIRERNRISIGSSALRREANLKIEDKSYRQMYFEKDPQAFNGTEVFVRIIAMSIEQQDTPAQRQFKRKRIEDIRQRLVDGQIDWKKALEEAGNPQLAASQGDLGWKSRFGLEEAMAKPAFELKQGEISPVIETPTTFALLQVRERREGKRTPDDPETIQNMKMWLEREVIAEAYRKTIEKHPIQRVRAPARTPLMASKERLLTPVPAPAGPATQPARPRPAAR